MDSQFINNTAKQWGGALYNWLGNLAVKNSTISNNTAGIRGGGIFTAGPLTTTLSQITDNDAETGGALYVFQEFYSIEPVVIFNNDTITGNTAVNGDIVYYLLLTYVKSDYENNYWGDINPNSTEWAKKFVTNEYTDASPKTWIEKHHQDNVENKTSENETDIEKTTSLNQKSANEKTTINLMTNTTLSLNQNSKSEITTTDFGEGMSSNSPSNNGHDSKSASYSTKKKCSP